jgi:molybdenum cofactor sulfurtransferase
MTSPFYKIWFNQGMINSRFDDFVSKYPEYTKTTSLDELRKTDYSRLDRNHEVYLDYTGAGLYAESQVKKHQQLLLDKVFGNPHSTNPTSLASSELVESARQAILKFFNASAEEYVVIFTANASGALKLVGEAYPFGPGSQYLLTFDNHNSVNGIREYALAKGAKVTYVPVLPPRMRLDEKRLDTLLKPSSGRGNNLFAFPAQSNFSAVQHPLKWIELAHNEGWDVLLDVAAFVPTNRLDLTKWQPDFVPVSFYKMFGYPSGIGALIARKTALEKLQRPWFAGGTITVASVQPERHYLAEAPAAFEDGTLDYLNIPAVEIGLKHLEAMGMEKIHERVRCLTGWLLDNLVAIKHDNGNPLVKIYGPITTDQRGGAIALNFVDPNGDVIDHRSIEFNANKNEISLRTGCFCNPGAGELALGISSGELTSCFNRPDHEQRLTYEEYRLCIDGKASGAVRVSVGMVSNFDDVEHFLEFVRGMVKRE